MAVAAVNVHRIPSPVSERRKRPPSVKAPTYPPMSSTSSEFYCQTREIIHECFHLLLSDNGIRSNGYTTGLVEPKFTSEVNKRAYHSLVATCRQFFKLNNDNIRGTVDKIDLSDSTLYTTFHTAMYSMFLEDIKWGRIVALVCFAVMVATKAHNRGKPLIIDSIEGWLISFICQNLQAFIVQNRGWAGVPDKFNPEKHGANGKNGGGSWLTLAAVGVGAALVTAFLSR